MAYENMSSLDMATALEEHKKGCSEGLLLAVAARLRDQYMRIWNLEEISDEEVIRSQCATRRAVERAIAAERERDRLGEALDTLQRSEAAYRRAHDVHGDGALAAGRAWDILRRAGDKARGVLFPLGGVAANQARAALKPAGGES